MTPRKNIPYYLTAIGLFILLKLGYTMAGTDDLIFLLSLTDKIVELSTGSQSVFIQGSGYFHQQLNILIDKSCSGFNFWLLCFLMLTFLTLKYSDNKAGKVSAVVSSFIGAYVLTILVNSARICTLIIIQNQNFPLTKHPIVHESVGITTNLTFLILIYLSVERVLINRNTNAKFA